MIWQNLKAKKWIIVALLLTIIVGGRFYYFVQREIPHFRTVKEDVLYRSGQPRGRGLDFIKMKGIKTIVNLRYPHGSGIEEERVFALKNGIAFHHLSLGITSQDLAATSEAFMKIMNDPANLPVLVHCSRGKERSGIMAAVYLINKEGWKNQTALQETYRLGLEPGRIPVAENFLNTYGRPKVVIDESVDAKTVNWLE